MLKDFDWVKAALITGMGVCALFLLRAWDDFTPPDSVPEDTAVVSATQDSDSANGLSTPAAPTANSNSSDEESPFNAPAQALNQGGLNSSAPTLPVAEALTAANTIEIKTDVLDLIVDLDGGDFIQADLINYHKALDDDTPFRILNRSNNHVYVAKSGLLVNTSGTYKPVKPIYQTNASRYELSENQDSLLVELVANEGDYRITKALTFYRENYLINVSHRIENRSDNNLQAALFAQIDRDDLKPPSSTGFGMQPYVGAAVTEPDKRYHKIDFDDMEDGLSFQTLETGWVALLQHYFVSAWIPSKDQSVQYSLGKYNSNNLYYLGFTQPATSVAAGQTANLDASFYVGPKDQYELEDIADHLDLTVDYGWLWWAAQPLYWVLQLIQSAVVNWGVAIILLTCLIKLIFFPLSAASYKSMARMRKLTPKMQALKERYGDDRQALSQETMKLYQKEKVNPLGGCLPILIQMPIFLALYWVLLEAVELRHAPFFLWIQDLSAKDPWFILPVLMGVSMLIQTRLNPTPPDPMQAKVMQFMPIMFSVMMAFFPAGLVLYWTVNNILGIAQQWAITRKIESA